MRTGLRVGLIIVESSRPVSEKKYQRIFQKEKKRGEDGVRVRN
jgi:hypothetical protein